MTSYWLCIVLAFAGARALLDKETTLRAELIIAIPVLFWLFASISYSLFMTPPSD